MANNRIRRFVRGAYSNADGTLSAALLPHFVHMMQEEFFETGPTQARPAADVVVDRYQHAYERYQPSADEFPTPLQVRRAMDYFSRVLQLADTRDEHGNLAQNDAEVTRRLPLPLLKEYMEGVHVPLSKRSTRNLSPETTMLQAGRLFHSRMQQLQSHAKSSSAYRNEHSQLEKAYDDFRLIANYMEEFHDLIRSMTGSDLDKGRGF
jgi:hypothetical protein